jgi:hypothetical protein
MLKQARPDLRFPGSAFLPEDDTRVRWLRPEEELLVIETMPSPFRDMLPQRLDRADGPSCGGEALDCLRELAWIWPEAVIARDGGRPPCGFHINPRVGCP